MLRAVWVCKWHGSLQDEKEDCSGKPGDWQGVLRRDQLTADITKGGCIRDRRPTGTEAGLTSIRQEWSV